MPLDPVVLIVEHSDRVSPRVVPSRAFIALSRRTGEEVRTVLRLDEPIGGDEELLVTLDGLPRPHAVYRGGATAGALILLLLFLLALAAGTRAASDPDARSA